jgi:hypothetical protein
MQMPTSVSKRKHIATIFGFLMAPLFAAIALSVIEVAKGHLDLRDTFRWTFIFYCFTLGATLIIGLPAYLLLRRFDKVTWWSAISTGIFSGAVMVLMFRPLSLLVMVIGGLSGLVFWAIWRLGNTQQA